MAWSKHLELYSVDKKSTFSQDHAAITPISCSSIAYQLVEVIPSLYSYMLVIKK